MTDFQQLQRAIEQTSQQRQAETRACEQLLSLLYTALRQSNGTGQPLNHVSMESATEDVRLRPLPLGSWHAVWLRLGLCEVRVRVQREGAGYRGEYGEAGVFRVQALSPEQVQGVASQMLRDLVATYQGELNHHTTLN